MNKVTSKAQPKNWHLRMKTLVSSESARLYYWCLGVTLVWRAGLELLNQTIVPLMSSGPGLNGEPIRHGLREGLLRWVNNWDAGWYNGITQHGYIVQHHFSGQESIAFFPLFPYSLRWFSEATGLSYKVSGLILNLLLTAGILFFIVRLTNLIAKSSKSRSDGPGLGKLAAVFFLLNPSAFFFAAYYADALLVLTITASIYFACRERYWAAGILAGLATATKSIGIVALPAILLLYLYNSDKGLLKTLKSGWLRLLAICGLSVSGLLAYMVYLWVRFGDPLEFIKIEKYWQRNTSGFFLNDLWGGWYAKIFDVHYFGSASNYLYDIFLMVIPIGALAVGIYLIARHGYKYLWLAIISLLTVLIPISTGTLLSLNRYVLILAPLYAYYFVYVYGRSILTKRLTFVIGASSSLMLVVFSLLFLSSRFAG